MEAQNEALEVYRIFVAYSHHFEALFWILIRHLDWIRIQIQRGPWIRRAKKTSKNRKVTKFQFLGSARCTLLRSEGSSCSLDILYGGLGIS